MRTFITIVFYCKYAGILEVQSNVKTSTNTRSYIAMQKFNCVGFLPIQPALAVIKGNVEVNIPVSYVKG